MSLNAESRVTGSITVEQFTDLMECSKVETKIDLGSAIVYRVQHTVLGALVLVNTVTGICGQLPI